MPSLKALFPYTCAIARVVLQRRVRWGALIVFCTWVAIGIPINIRARIYRRDAQRMLNDLRALRMLNTPGSVALALRDRYEMRDVSWSGKVAQPCTAENCVFMIATRWEPAWDFALSHPRFERLVPSLVGLWYRFGLRLVNETYGTVTVQRGLVTAIDFDITTQLMDERDARLLAGGQTVNNFSNHAEAWDIALHPNFAFWQPNSCKFCRDKHVLYTQQISASDFQRLTNFDLSCLTSWSGCNDPAEIMPAYALQERADAMDHPKTLLPGCLPGMVRAHARDFPFVALVKVLRAGPVTEERPEFEDDSSRHNFRQWADYELVQELKPESARRIQSKHFMHGSGEPIASELLRTGNRLIVFARESRSSYVQKCGITVATPENLEQAKAGVADDSTRCHDWSGRVLFCQ
jgi:hypothetical protein